LRWVREEMEMGAAGLVAIGGHVPVARAVSAS
jgi:hypothetical protein